MAKLSEIFSNIFGMDMNKEYDINVPTPAPAPTINSTVEQITQPNNIIEQVTPNTNTVADNTNDYKAMYEAQQKEIESLKLANKALLNQTPVSNPQLSLEDMIYRAVIGEPTKQQ